MKRICFFNSIPFWGGGEKLHLENALEFKAKGYDVCVLTNPNSLLKKKCVQNHIETFDITVGNLSFINPYKLINLVNFYKKQAVDTVIFTASQDVKLGAIAAKLAGVTRIVYLRGLAVEVKSSVLNKYLYKSVLTHIISNSEATKRLILKNLADVIPNTKVKTIYHGIKLDDETESRKNEDILSKAHGVVLGNAGRLTAQKGQSQLIQIAKILKDKGVDFSLFLAGDGELKDTLQQEIESQGLQNDVHILGFVEDVEAFMNSIDIFLLSSIWEGFGFVIVEAMQKSKPVVAFNLSSNPEIISADNTGFLVDYPDLEAFANKTMDLIKDVSLRKKMGTAARESVIQRFILAERVTELEQYLLNS